MKTPLQTAIERLKAEKDNIQYNALVNRRHLGQEQAYEIAITILESLLPEERKRFIGFAKLSRFAANQSIEKLFSILYYL